MLNIIKEVLVEETSPTSTNDTCRRAFFTAVGRFKENDSLLKYLEGRLDRFAAKRYPDTNHRIIPEVPALNSGDPVVATSAESPASPDAETPSIMLIAYMIAAQLDLEAERSPVKNAKHAMRLFKPTETAGKEALYRQLSPCLSDPERNELYQASVAV